MPTLAAVILVGPSAQDSSRLVDLFASLKAYCTQLRCCVLVDDARAPRELSELRPPGWSTEIVVVPHPRRGAKWPLKGTHCAGVIVGLQALRGRNIDMVLKLDLDALVIGPFESDLASFVEANPRIGLLGCVGETCDRAHELYRHCMQRRSNFREALELSMAIGADEFSRGATVPVKPRDAAGASVTAEQYRAFQAVRPAIERAIDHGMTTQRYCQGGAYALTRTMFQRMEAHGYLDDPSPWLALPFFGEDEMIAMFAYAVDLEIGEFSDVGQPFGLSYNGLPFSPRELVDRGHAIVHSLKNDPRGSEAELRAFFAARRGQAKPQLLR